MTLPTPAASHTLAKRRRRRAWRNEHHDDLAHLRQIDTAIDERASVWEPSITVARDHPKTVEHDLGIDLGW